jgi:putative aminopeptidase FrvX
MFILDSDVDACVSRLVELLAVPSPSGYTAQAEAFVDRSLRSMSIAPQRTKKRMVLCDLGGRGHPLVLQSHVDTLGAMVRSIKETGRLRFSKIGGSPDAYIVTKNCLVHTMDGPSYSGTIQPVNPAAHVNRAIRELKPEEESLEIVLDEAADSRAQVQGLGISAGDFVSFEPRTVVTGSGYIKSRHLDDKASAAVLLTLAALVAESRVNPARRVYLLFTTYEEVGHGASAGLPIDVEEAVSVDMGAVGADLTATEQMVSICAKDSGGPYDRWVTAGLVRAAKRAGADYAVDIYPYYGSDVEASLRAGYDILHGLIGPGVAASHGYERTHRDGLANTLKTLAEYIAAPPEWASP